MAAWQRPYRSACLSVRLLILRLVLCEGYKMSSFNIDLSAILKFFYFRSIMKYLHTVLLLTIAIALGANFYLDHKRDLACQAKTEAALPVIRHKAEETSPFDKPSNDPLQAAQKPQIADLTTISFEHTAHDFGRVESGPVYTATFKYKNTGNSNLYISAAEASCGCTVPTWSKDAIRPGNSADITVQFDSKGRVGEQLKTVTVTTNTDPTKNVLTLHTLLYLKTK
jgi:hypothetical protein